MVPARRAIADLIFKQTLRSKAFMNTLWPHCVFLFSQITCIDILKPPTFPTQYESYFEFTVKTWRTLSQEKFASESPNHMDEISHDELLLIFTTSRLPGFVGDRWENDWLRTFGQRADGSTYSRLGNKYDPSTRWCDHDGIRGVNRILEPWMAAAGFHWSDSLLVSTATLLWVKIDRLFTPLKRADRFWFLHDQVLSLPRIAMIALYRAHTSSKRADNAASMHFA